MSKVIYNCLVCGGQVSTDANDAFTCTCEDGPTAPPLQAAHELAGNGAGHVQPVPKNRLELDPVEEMGDDYEP